MHYLELGVLEDGGVVRVDPPIGRWALKGRESSLGRGAQVRGSLSAARTKEAARLHHQSEAYRRIRRGKSAQEAS